ncbi:protein FAR1-RELATED SEQUENCE 5-like [Juglans regia]|uniref:Protein FAR1-RELATED SEQUENCE n=1 Tax=Juglans regia TaxID=51240 RepID=A0A6P9EIE3_JUGRE|nr:protein FAR1-RELATED SEQUENCE 5-like [Juglans regia]
MEKGKEHASPITPPTTNPSTNSSNQMIPRPFYTYFSTPPCIDTSINPATESSTSSPIGLNTASSSHVEEIQEPTPDSREVETLSTPSESKDDNETETEIAVHTEGGADIIEEPKLGMVFNSEEELISYYKSYGKQCDFEIMTQRSHRFENGRLRYITLGCARGGKAQNRTTNVARPHPTSKIGCNARINATFFEGVLKFLTVHNTHNHGLSPQKSRFFRCNREVSLSVKRMLDTKDQAGIRMNKSFAALVQEAGGFENLSFNEKNCRNYIDKACHIRLGKGGAGALHEYFARMQYKNNGFFSLLDIDDNGRLKNIFWADARSRASYKYFGEIVTFDTTYLTNRYGMPFAPFVGVNHHGQSILLGAGLISNEDTETFTWLFQSWLNCMDGEASNAIITDQDRAMKNAIALVFPNTRHRFCLWHILKKVPKKLGSHGAYKDGLKSQLLKCVYDSQTIEEFEKCWEVMITTYNLQENAWTNLKEFVDQFDNALRKKIENENATDFHSFNVTIPAVSISPLEKIFQATYINSKFREVPKEVIGMIGVLPTLHRKDGVIATYHVEDEVCVDDFIKETCISHYES